MVNGHGEMYCRTKSEPSGNWWSSKAVCGDQGPYWAVSTPTLIPDSTHPRAGHSQASIGTACTKLRNLFQGQWIQPPDWFYLWSALWINNAHFTSVITVQTHWDSWIRAQCNCELAPSPAALSSRDDLDTDCSSLTPCSSKRHYFPPYTEPTKAQEGWARGRSGGFSSQKSNLETQFPRDQD